MLVLKSGLSCRVNMLSMCLCLLVLYGVSSIRPQFRHTYYTVAHRGDCERSFFLIGQSFNKWPAQAVPLCHLGLAPASPQPAVWLMDGTDIYTWHVTLYKLLRSLLFKVLGIWRFFSFTFLHTHTDQRCCLPCFASDSGVTTVLQPTMRPHADDLHTTCRLF